MNKQAGDLAEGMTKAIGMKWIEHRTLLTLLVRAVGGMPR
jgi:hypothetical protein